MTKKLIQTNFSYIVPTSVYGRMRINGSYLGRKPASIDTIMRRLSKVWGHRKAQQVIIGESFQSPYIAK